MTGVTHHGEYNPWAELEKPEVKKLYDECVATGGFAYRTGHVILGSSRVRIDENFNVTVEKTSPDTYVNDGLSFVRFA